MQTSPFPSSQNHRISLVTPGAIKRSVAVDLQDVGGSSTHTSTRDDNDSSRHRDPVDGPPRPASSLICSRPPRLASPRTVSFSSTSVLTRIEEEEDPAIQNMKAIEQIVRDMTVLVLQKSTTRTKNTGNSTQVLQQKLFRSYQKLQRAQQEFIGDLEALLREEED